MVDKHEDWIEALREAATPEGGELPEGLWNRISASLDAAPPSTGAFPPHIVRRRRLRLRAASAAAAAVIAAIGVFVLLTLTKDFDDVAAVQPEVPAGGLVPAANPADVVGEPVRTATEAIEPPHPHTDDLRVAEAVGGLTDLSLTATAAGSAAARQQNAVTQTEPQTAPALTAEPETKMETKTKTEKDIDKKEVVLPPQSEVRTEVGALPRRGHSRTAAVKSPSRRGMLAVSASGMPSRADASPQNAPVMMKTAALAPNKDGLMVMEARAPQYSYRHRQPLTFAVSLDFGVGRNLYAGTGVTYTRLSSTAREKSGGEEFGQLLQYVGIPATFKWSFLDRGLFMLYAGAEAQAEFCVAARFDDRKADGGTMQLSLHGLAGAQLNLGRHAGIYVEPKLSHYFIDTPLPTIRNTRGVNFNLQFGLRFSY